MTLTAHELRYGRGGLMPIELMLLTLGWTAERGIQNRMTARPPYYDDEPEPRPYSFRRAGRVPHNRRRPHGTAPQRVPLYLSDHIPEPRTRLGRVLVQESEAGPCRHPLH
ncbi:hypothetical protein LCGC14_2960420 [marine sediment metagenome]|uniref:Uncharacterized protein n=1 Tax=marine sediment metagenome TaxID=412755 RepID=A0A0F8ZK66_9ZZZZ